MGGCYLFIYFGLRIAHGSVTEIITILRSLDITDPW